MSQEKTIGKCAALSSFGIPCREKVARLPQVDTSYPLVFDLPPVLCSRHHDLGDFAQRQILYSASGLVRSALAEVGPLPDVAPSAQNGDVVSAIRSATDPAYILAAFPENEAQSLDQVISDDMLLDNNRRQRYSLKMTAAAQNAHTPPLFLAALYRVGDSGVKDSVAANINTPPELLAHIVQHGFVSYNGQGSCPGAKAAANPATPWSAISDKLLSQPADIKVLTAAAHTNPNAGYDILDDIAQKCHDPHTVWEAERLVPIAENQRTSVHILIYLADEAMSHIPVGLTGTAGMPVLLSLATRLLQNQRLPELQKNNLADSENWQVRAAVANRQATSEATLQKLSDDTNEDVLSVLACRNDCPPEVLRKLADNEAPSLRRMVASNGNASSDILHLLMLDKDSLIATIATQSLQARKNGHPTDSY